MISNIENTYEKSLVDNLRKELDELCYIYNNCSYFYSDDLLLNIRKRQNELMRIAKEMREKNHTNWTIIKYYFYHFGNEW